MGKTASPAPAPAPVEQAPADQASPPPADQVSATAALTEVRVLIDCQHGKVNAVATLNEAELADAVASGTVDPHPDAVAHAKHLAASAGQA